MSQDQNPETRTYSYDEGEIGNLIEGLIAGLVVLRDKTHPGGGDESAKGKDIAAFEALTRVGHLAKAAAQWAIDHQVGLALEGLQFVPLAGAKTKKLPQYIEERSNVDSHRHEAAGMRINERPGGPPRAVLTTEQRRAVAISMLRANAGGFPDGIAEELCEALEALSFGKTAPIIQPVKGWRKAGLLRKREQFNAVCFALFRSKTKIVKAGDAWEQIAQAYGVDSSTLQGWRKDARKEFGTVFVARKEEYAENAASHIAVIRNSNLSRAVEMLRSHDRYGDVALMRSVERYKIVIQTEPSKARGTRRKLKAVRIG